MFVDILISVVCLLAIYGILVFIAEAKRKSRRERLSQIPNSELRDHSEEVPAQWEKGFWYILHNVFAHPFLVFSLLGEIAESFHAYTERKM